MQDYINKYLAHIEHNRNFSPQTLRAYRNDLRQYLSFLTAEGCGNLVENVRSPKLDRNLPGFMSINETETLLNTPNLSTLLGIRDSAIMETLYSTGMRVSELAGMNVADVDFDKGLVKVKGKGKKERLLPIG